jgi:pimeloyl-ACP methyl ester carboxylesterase
VHIDRSDTDTLVIYAHGFMSNKNHRMVPRFVEHLSEHFDVMAFDFRGHGESGGFCSFGDVEMHDLETVVQYARSLSYQRVVTIGSSMGGATVLRHAGIVGGIEGVITIGAFADARNLRRMIAALGLHFAFHTPFGNHFTTLTRGTRLGALSIHEQQPIDVVHQIKAPLLLIHGEWDMLIHPNEARRLYARANTPKELLIVPRRGHDMPLLTRETADRIQQWVAREVEGGYTAASQVSA